jgi:hypothetical protein
MHEGTSNGQEISEPGVNDSLRVSLTKTLSDFLLRLSVRVWATNLRKPRASKQRKNRLRRQPQTRRRKTQSAPSRSQRLRSNRGARKRKNRVATKSGVRLLMVPVKAAQDHLKTDTEIRGPVLQFDWPTIQIGIGSYEEGPTGLTIFRFPDSGLAAVDVRGGSPGTVNTDYLRLGYEEPNVDAVVFWGGSGYGEEANNPGATGF